MDKNNKDTEKKDQKNEQEPWEQPIYDDDDEASRANRRTKGEGRNWYMITLITLLFLVVIVTTFAILYWNVNAKMNTKKPEVESSMVVKKESSTSESSTESSSTTESTSSSTTSSSTTTTPSTTETSSTFADVERPVDQAQQQNNGQANTTSPNANAATGSEVIVGQGGNVNLYRIAINNGMTVDELLQLNPGVNPQALQDGQAIRIK
ncbi:hypothetical protein CBF34_05730 [Vagococcus penaei]|uniref:Uncharacterized protein n=1 Tax=Vagococcus penaei TaxID=633807 RepID=A0A1Q2D3S7_9ENTE|nr:LysM domain-containing protein [Vagococcus penaei]AQP52965.1 hypothetical protein BW732_01160 [Vagococcus penaei]RSU02575.1 hypothetical protein CBF34_05730 [Vagococcus penaei]